VELELFEKTEIWIESIQIRDVNLESVAEKVAEVLNLKKHEVMVVDVREGVLVLDVMRKVVHAQDIVGKRDVLLKALSDIPGISPTPETSLHSEGVLGLIDIKDPKAAKELLEKMDQMRSDISDHIQKRAIVFPSGFEVQSGLIQDTNSPYLKNRLAQAGFNVTIGEVLEDDRESIALTLNRAVNEGYGLIITTGGVGAEDKDRMIEALLALDPKACTPYIIHYERGTGRHEKDGVKIGVAYLRPSFIIALPGPHQEVRAGIEVVLEGLERQLGKEQLAESLSERYRQLLRNIHHVETKA
jgi:molybdenum cofactor synthesis domain-containing protein